jgi:hypothetical protein
MMTTNEFRSIIASGNVPGYTCQNPSSGCTNQAPFSKSFNVPASASVPSVNMSDFTQVGLSVLWDTGAYGVEHLDQHTFAAYNAGFTVSAGAPRAWRVCVLVIYVCVRRDSPRLAHAF